MSSILSPQPSHQSLRHKLLQLQQIQKKTMAHSKRNTSLPHFTSYERGLLRSTWGTKRGVIGRDSFLPFASCRLCLQPARAPVVACATNGDLFCRECAINDLLAQRQEIKRLERQREDARKRLAEGEEGELEEERRKELAQFELVSMGLEGGGGGNQAGKKRKAEGSETEEAMAKFKAREVEIDGKRKRVFELNEKEMARYAEDEKERLKKELKREKVFLFTSFLSYPSGVARTWILTLLSSPRPNPLYLPSGSHPSRRARIPMRSPPKKQSNSRPSVPPPRSPIGIATRSNRWWTCISPKKPARMGRSRACVRAVRRI